MLQVFKSLKWFTILYFFVVVIDVFVKLCLPLTSYRYATKVLLIVLVILFYHNNKDHNRKKRLFVYTALSFFFMGDILVLNHSNTVVLVSRSFNNYFLHIFGVFNTCWNSKRKNNKKGLLVFNNVL